MHKPVSLSEKCTRIVWGEPRKWGPSNYSQKVKDPAWTCQLEREEAERLYGFPGEVGVLYFLRTTEVSRLFIGITGHSKSTFAQDIRVLTTSSPMFAVVPFWAPPNSPPLPVRYVCFG